MAFKKKEGKKTMSKQDENWELMSVLGFPWDKANELSDSDRTYLLERVVEVKNMIDAQNEERKAQEKEYTDQIVANATPNPDSNEPPVVKLGMQ